MNANNLSANLTAELEQNASIAHYNGISNGLRLYVTPVIMFGGTIGNVLTIIVVFSHHFRYSPSSVPLITLAFVDIGVLYFNLLDVWLGTLLDADSLQYVRGMSATGCKLSTFLTLFLTHCSSWILVLINIERVASVYQPLKARVWCSRRRLALALAIILVILAAISLHLFWTTAYFPDKKFDRCQYDYELLGDHGESAWVTIDACLFTFVPFVVILACNIAIIYSLIQAKRRRIKHYHVRHNHPSDSTRSVTTMLVTISIVFVLTTSPLTICYQFYDQLMPGLAKDPVGRAFWYDLIINTVLLLLCYSNNAVNFLLYCISGSKFRFALLSVCTGRSGKRYSYTHNAFLRTTLRSSLEDLGTPSVNGGIIASFNYNETSVSRLSSGSRVLPLVASPCSPSSTSSAPRNRDKWLRCSSRQQLLKKKTSIV